MKYYHIINGERVSGDDWIERRNPADTDEVVSLFPKARAEIARSAIGAAESAFPSWAATPAPARGDILLRAGDMMEKRAEELATVMTREEGKTLAESRAEVRRASDIFRYYGAEGRRISGETLPPDKPDSFLFTRREPLGVVSIITPWNFPMVIPAWKLAPALVAGCTVVFKPASLVPLCGLRLVEILEDAGLPRGVLNFVVGSGSDVGHELVTHPSIKGISFTGSYAVGHGIHVQAAPNIVRTQLEMGGKNPLLVLDDANLELAVNLAAVGGFGLTGQACTATSRVIVQRGILKEFTERLVSRARSLSVGNGLTGATMGPAVDQSQLETDLAYVEIGRREGARLAAGGTRLESDAPGYFLAPTVFTDVWPAMRIAQEEIFGPIVSIMAMEDLEEGIHIANGIEYGLSAGLVTNNLHDAFHFAERVEAGIVKINQTTGGVLVQAPFGGFKKSSSNTFREQGKNAIDFYSRTKTIYLDYPA